MQHETMLSYYAQPGVMTSPGAHAPAFDGLPSELPALCAVVQGLLIHPFWTGAYGVTLPEERQEEVQLRSVEEMLTRLLALDDRPLTVARPADRRLVGNCRHFSTCLCAILRHHGVPARARCGFGAYFMAGSFEDHWVCEYWNAAQSRWVMVDAQLDAVQRNVVKPPFDVLDVPRDQFIIAGDAWQRCRSGAADPQRFGIFDMRGLWFIRGNVVRDLAALNRIELLPWDAWGLMSKVDADQSAEDLVQLDRVAALTLADDDQFAAVRAVYEGDDRWRVPKVIRSYTQTGERTVTLPI
ncbi:MAG TPA: transglutaminase-like domain-containing protein [Candidatus Binatia bacterium]|nr:transglutaminase-like domain-containing protein [Candidatus Binatia bacterium]